MGSGSRWPWRPEGEGFGHRNGVCRDRRPNELRWLALGKEALATYPIPEDAEGPVEKATLLKTAAAYSRRSSPPSGDLAMEGSTDPKLRRVRIATVVVGAWIGVMGPLTIALSFGFTGGTNLSLAILSAGLGVLLVLIGVVPTALKGRPKNPLRGRSANPKP